MKQKRPSFPSYDACLLPITVLSADGKIIYQNDIFKALKLKRHENGLPKSMESLSQRKVFNLNFDGGTLSAAFFECDGDIVGILPTLGAAEAELYESKFPAAEHYIRFENSIAPFMRQAMSAAFFEGLESEKERESLKGNLIKLKRLEMRLHVLAEKQLSSFGGIYGQKSRCIPGIAAANALTKLDKTVRNIGYEIELSCISTEAVHVRSAGIFLSALLCGIFSMLKCSSDGKTAVSIRTDRLKTSAIEISSETDLTSPAKMITGDLEFIAFCLDCLGGSLNTFNGRDMFRLKLRIPECQDGRLPEEADYTFLTKNGEIIDRIIDSKFIVSEYESILVRCGLDFFGDGALRE